MFGFKKKKKAGDEDEAVRSSDRRMVRSKKGRDDDDEFGVGARRRFRDTLVTDRSISSARPRSSLTAACAPRSAETKTKTKNISTTPSARFWIRTSPRPRVSGGRREERRVHRLVGPLRRVIRRAKTFRLRLELFVAQIVAPVPFSLRR